MNIQWYPGHMTKARRAMQEDVKAVDLIIELVDARAPSATRNPDIEALGRGKERVILLNKADLAEDDVSYQWISYFKSLGIPCFFMDARNKQQKKRLMGIIEKAGEKKRERDRKKGILNRPLRAMVAGIPNVGKSTLINTIAGRGMAKTADRPGVTRGNQWIRLNPAIELLDTPGILWPKFEDPDIGLKIAFLGSINEMTVDVTELAAELIRFLRKEDRLGGFLKRYGFEEEATAGGGSEMAAVLEKVALRRGCLREGGVPDTEKAAGLLLNEFREGKLGRISLETPPKTGDLKTSGGKKED